AGILAWADKYKYNYWRPVVAIREHDASMGPQGVASNNISNACDTGWLPLGGPKTNEPGKKNFTPPFPAYPSGHATFGAAALHITRLFYGDAGPNTDQLFKDLSLVSEEFDGVNVDNKGTVRPRHVRNFQDGLWQMMIENSRSRVFLGVHWVFDGFATTGSSETPDLNRFVGGVPLGMRIAEDIFNKGANLGLKKSNV
ncbi:MAG: vanadium-dependent haloperoxidase, partial [Runella sp.]